MRTDFLLIVILFISFNGRSFSQTNANIATSGNVLVVYKMNDDTSRIIKDYYVEKRNIPSTNVIGVTLPERENVFDPVSGITHLIKLSQFKEIIEDSVNNANYAYPGTIHAWMYFKNHIADTLEYYLNNTYLNGEILANKIRYIVLCKGIPHRIMAAHDYSWSGYYNNLCLDGLICLLNQTDPNKFFLNLFGNTISTNLISNPYKDVDPTYTMDYRFITNHFINSNNWQLSYLVSRLDGLTYEDVKSIIDKSIASDMSGNSTWVIDNDPDGVAGYYLDWAKDELNSLEFNTNWNNTDQWITQNSSTPVIGYTSHGVHADDPSNPYTYIQDSLNFIYANGSIFNTHESFNGHSLGSLTRRDGAFMGLLTEFILTEGNCGVGHTWEPGGGNWSVIDVSIQFPAYAMGYSVVDAAYLGMPYLARQNVVVGDPLTTIAWGKQTTTKNISMTGTNLITDTTTINTGDTLTFNSSAHLNLKHHGFVTGSCTLQVESNVIISSTDWQRALLLAAENDHPKLVWSVNPDMTPFTKYRIYREIDTKPWKLIDRTTYQYYLDNVLVFSDPEGGIGEFVQYYVISVNNTSASVPSNTVSGMFNKAQTGKIILPQTQLVENYNLSQNYPNPFNPSTVINYAIKEAGLVKIKVYDILRDEVAVIVDEPKQVGFYSVKFNASKLPSGVYIYTIKSNDFTASKKLMLLK